MKFTVEIDEFWLDEDSNRFEEELKKSIMSALPALLPCWRFPALHC